MAVIQASNWTLADLTPNTQYYWSVQAVDVALTGSEFAVEGTFMTDVTPPSVNLTAPAQTSSITPLATVTASDTGSGVPDGTAVALDVDLNNDGDFSDTGETDYTPSALVSGTTTFAVTPALAEGTYHFPRSRE